MPIAPLTPATTPQSRLPARGMTLIETLMVVTIAGIVFMLAVPKFGVTRDAAARRAARQQLIAAFAATKATAIQKGKNATLTLTPSTATVTALTGLAGTEVTIWGPIAFGSDMHATIEALDGAPTTLVYNARGLLTPSPGWTQRYRLTIGGLKDTVCINPSGIILPKGCEL